MAQSDKDKQSETTLDGLIKIANNLNAPSLFVEKVFKEYLPILSTDPGKAFEFLEPTARTHDYIKDLAEYCYSNNDDNFLAFAEKYVSMAPLNESFMNVKGWGNERVASGFIVRIIEDDIDSLIGNMPFVFQTIDEFPNVIWSAKNPLLNEVKEAYDTEKDMSKNPDFLIKLGQLIERSEVLIKGYELKLEQTTTIHKLIELKESFDKLNESGFVHSNKVSYNHVNDLNLSINDKIYNTINKSKKIFEYPIEYVSSYINSGKATLFRNIIVGHKLKKEWKNKTRGVPYAPKAIEFAEAFYNLGMKDEAKDYAINSIGGIFLLEESGNEWKMSNLYDDLSKYLQGDERGMKMLQSELLSDTKKHIETSLAERWFKCVNQVLVTLTDDYRNNLLDKTYWRLENLGRYDLGLELATNFQDLNKMELYKKADFFAKQAETSASLGR